MAPTPVPCTFSGYDGSKDDDFLFHFESHGRIYSIAITRESCDQFGTPYLGRLHDATSSGDDILEDAIIEELVPLLASLCQPWFRLHEPVKKKRSRTILDILYPPTSHFGLVTIDGELQLRELDTTPLSHRENVSCGDFQTDAPVYSASEVEILDVVKPNVLKAAIHNSTLCVKIIGHHHPQVIQREINILQDLANISLGCELHFPKLLGLVASPENELVGFCMTYIEGCIPLESLRMVDLPKIQRRGWGRQIEATLHALHSKDVVWGDAKADNILIDREGQLWMTDYGGGTTAGWVDERLAGTKEGDLQGLSQIHRFLGTD